MNLYNLLKSKYKLSFLLFTIAVFSFHSNFFKAVNDEWFLSHSIDSETLVFDGILNSLEEKKPFFLGNYKHIDKKVNPKKIRENFNKFKSGNDFKRYKSQYGLQIKIFGGLCNFGLCNLELFYLITSILMGLVIVVFYNLVKRDFGNLSGILLSLFLTFSPWLIVFSKNIFWMTFTLFLPFLVSFYFSNKLKNNYFKLFFFITIFFSFFIKMLNGYEYITTIFLSTLVPLIYQFIEQNKKFFHFLKYSFVIFIIFLTSFATSIFLQSKSSNYNVKEHIVERLEYHTYNIENSTSKIENKVKNFISTSIRYFVFRDFLPWTWIGQAGITNEEKTYIKDSFKNFNSKILIHNFSKLSKNTKAFLFLKIIEILIFLLILSYLIFIFRHLKRSMKYSISLAFISSISWILLGNKHSQLHFHINYIVWYIPFIPYAVITIINHRYKE